MTLFAVLAPLRRTGPDIKEPAPPGMPGDREEKTSHDRSDPL